MGVAAAPREWNAGHTPADRSGGRLAASAADGARPVGVHRDGGLAQGLDRTRRGAAGIRTEGRAMTMLDVAFWVSLASYAALKIAGY